MPSPAPDLHDDFRHEPPFPPDFLFPQADWSGLGDLRDLRGHERRLRQENLVPLAYVRLRERLAFPLLTMDMQNRWLRAYEETRDINAEAIITLHAVASMASPRRALLLGAFDALCTLYPDPGVRPVERLRLLIERAAERTSWHDALESVAYHASSTGHYEHPRLPPLSLEDRLTPAGAHFDSTALFSRATCAAQVPVALHEGLFITHEAPRLTADARRTAGEAARAWSGRNAPAQGGNLTESSLSPGPGGGASPSGTPSLSQAADPHAPGDEAGSRVINARADATNLFLMSREDAFLLALIEHAVRATDARRGLYAWELSEMSRRWSFDWDRVVREARKCGVHAIVDATLAEIEVPWRAAVNETARRKLRGGILARTLIAMLGPTRAQQSLQSRFLRRL